MTDFQEVNGYRVVRELGRGDATKPPAAIATAWGLKVGDVISGVERYTAWDKGAGDIVFLRVVHIGLKCVLWEERMYTFSADVVEPKLRRIDAETAAYSLSCRSWRLMERIPEPKAERAEPAKDRVIHSRDMGVKVTLRENGEVELEDSKGATEVHALDGGCKTIFRHVDRSLSLTTVTTRLWSPSGEFLGTQKLVIGGQAGDTVETWLDRDDKMVKEVATIGDSVITTTVERSSSRRTDEQPR
jgi:hypothetical protein